MCGRYTVLTEDEIIRIRNILRQISLGLTRDEIGADDTGDRKEVFPTNTAPVITRDKLGVNFESIKWGFKKWQDGGVIINARAETLKEKVMFAKLLFTGRCVVPAGEFFEWERIGGKKKKYFAKDRGGNLLFMAGLYRNVRDNESVSGYSREFVIITKNSVTEINKIHSRMPVLLRVDQIEPWLNGKMSPEELVSSYYEVEIAPCEDEN